MLDIIKKMAEASESFDEESVRCLNCGRVVYFGPPCCDKPVYKKGE